MAIELFAATVLLDDHVGDFIDAFVGGETFLAAEALAAAADGVAFFAFARIDDLVFEVAAERTQHG